MKDISLKSKTGFLLFCLLLLAIISRIPLLYPDRMILDGDEALMGLMSIHQIELGEIPWYFWGQQYGFTLIEVSSISVFHLLLGYNDLAVKLGMMLIWLLALTGAFLFLKEKLGRQWAFVVVLLFVLHPVWFYWSLKARGGYLTALMLSSWLFYFASIHRRIPAVSQGLIQGIGLAVIFHSMKLWFPSSVVLVFGLLWPMRKKWTLGASMLVSGILSHIALHQISLQNPDYWNPHVVDIDLLWHNLISMRERLRHMFEGNYFLGDFYPIFNWTFIAWEVVKYAFLVSLAFSLLQFRENLRSVEFWALTLATAIPLGVMLISPMFFSPRYLLPFPLFLFMWCAWQWKNFRYTRLLRIIWIPMALAIYAGAWQLTQTDYYKREAEEKIIRNDAAHLLIEKDYTYVLCNVAELHWQLMYYSGGKLVCTGIYPHDRLQELASSVRQAYWDGEKVIAVSSDNQEYRHMQDSMIQVGGLWMLPKPRLEDLEKMGFEMRVMY
ncbi:MAG: hypothetical protein GC180_03785 [Bacteroidetes bacterium]|nr:hypothetical protein [Bacteroidota bacterium]